MKAENLTQRKILKLFSFFGIQLLSSFFLKQPYENYGDEL